MQEKNMFSENMPSQVRDLILPYNDDVGVINEADFYGASLGVANLAHMKIRKSFSTWSHGWSSVALKYPEQIVWDGSWKYYRLVGSKTVEIFLRNEGFKNVKAVGFPILYTEKKEVLRCAKSVLFMPAHSLIDVDIAPKIDEMIAFAVKLKLSGSYVSFCVHADCMQHGKTIPLLDRHGIDWFVGSSVNDSYSLQRMRNIFSYFDVVTSNTIGSHFVYSQLFGAKFFFSEPYFEYKQEQFSKHPFYEKRHKLRKYTMDQLSLKIIQQKYFKYFQGFENAFCDQKFAEIECGVPDQVEPKTLGLLLGWGFKHQLLGYVFSFSDRVYRGIVRYLEKNFRMK